MRRRDFLSICSVGLASSVCGDLPVRAAGTFTALDAIKSLRITAGSMKDAFVVAPYGMVNWYFANVGLYPFVGRLRAEVKAYLNLYLQRMDPVKANIRDVLLTYNGNPQTPEFSGTVLQDSDDAYAATILSLASKYDALYLDTVWWNANVAKLKLIAYQNLLTKQKPTGLIRTHQDPNATAYSTIGYLMDNCEAYRGLNEFVARLRARNDPEVNYFGGFANGIAIGVKSLFDPVAKAFRVSDASGTVGTKFYPDATAQIFPQLYGVTTFGLGSAQYTQGWSYLNAVAPGWENCGKDDFPWMVLGYIGSLRGWNDKEKARTQLRMVEQLFVANRARVTINELGFYKRTADVLRLPA